MFIQKVSKTHWMLLIGGSLLITMKAEASCHIHPADGDVAKVRSAASTAGAVYKNSVCGLAITTRDGEMFGASGFLVSKPDGGTAKIVTTGHDFYNPHTSTWDDITSVQVTFRGEIDFYSPIRASRVDIRDGFHTDSKGKNSRNDVATIEVPRDLIPADCVPLEFYAGTGYKKPSIEAFHGGYSRFCTTKTGCDGGIPKLYGGLTSVTYTSSLGYSNFRTYLCSAYTPPTDMSAKHEDVVQFNPSFKNAILRPVPTGKSQALIGALRAITPTRESQELIGALDPTGEIQAELIEQGLLCICQPHQKQSIMGLGGSGGPLLFNTKGGPRVAGIYSRIEPFVHDSQIFIAACYEPIMTHAAWILSDDPAKSVAKRYVF